MTPAAIARAVRATAPVRVPVALRAALCVGAPLALGLALGQPHAGAAASFGGLAAVYVPDTPYRYRARAVALIGLGLALGVLLGGLASGDPVLAVVVAGVAATAASFACQALEVPPPREFLLLLALLVATDIPGTPVEALGRAGLAACGAVFAWLVTMAPGLRAPRAPETRAVATAFAAVAGLLDAVGTPDAATARNAAVAAVGRARRAAVQAGRGGDDPIGRAVGTVEALLEAALHVHVEADDALDPRWAAAVRAVGRGEPIGALPEAGAFVGADLLAAALTGAGPRAYPPLPGPRGPGALLRAAAAGDSVVLPSALRLGIAVAVGVGLGKALGLGHAYWVGLTVVAVLQGSNLAVTRRRVLHRVAGTVVGLVLAYAVLVGDPSPWVVVLAAVAFQFLTELFVATHYGLAVVAITPLSMLLFHLGSPTSDLPVALGERLLDTVIGVAVGLLLRVALWPRVTSARLPQLEARTVAAVRRVFAAAWAGPPGPALADARRALQGDLATLRAMHADALADTSPLLRPQEPQWAVSSAVEDLAILALSLPPTWAPPEPGQAAAFLADLDALSAALAGAGEPPAAVPGVPALPRATAAARELAAALG